MNADGYRFAIVVCAVLCCSVLGAFVASPGLAVSAPADAETGIDLRSQVGAGHHDGLDRSTTRAIESGATAFHTASAAPAAPLEAEVTTAAWTTATATTVDADPAPVAGRPDADGSTIVIRRTLTRNGTDQGVVLVTVEYAVGDRISDFQSSARGDVTVLEADGLSVRDGAREGWTVFDWDGRTTGPTVTFEWPVDHPSDHGGYDYVDVGAWSLVPVPYVSTIVYAPGDVTRVYETRFDGEGAGTWTAFLGPHDELVATVGDETVRLIVPEAANTRVEPESILTQLKSAATRLEVFEHLESEALAQPTVRSRTVIPYANEQSW